MADHNEKMEFAKRLITQTAEEFCEMLEALDSELPLGLDYNSEYKKEGVKFKLRINLTEL